MNFDMPQLNCRIQFMKTFSNSNTTIEFIGQSMVHVTFKKEGMLSTHVLRDLIVAFKAQFGEAPKALVFSLYDQVESERFFRKISNRTQQIAPGTLISLICHSKLTLAKAEAFFEENKPDYPIAVFSDYKRALDWLECKMIGTETIKMLSAPNTFAGMTA
jgi:hypothetical protein